MKLVVDEWGARHNDTTAVAPQHLFGSFPTMRDAVIAGLTLDTFHRHADKVAMANAAQLINCIQTLFLADGDRFCVTPTYQVCRMYKDHNNGQSLRALFAAPEIGYELNGKPRQIVRLARATVLTGPDLHAHNDFAHPDAVQPAQGQVEATASELRIRIPAASVVKIQADLG